MRLLILSFFVCFGAVAQNYIVDNIELKPGFDFSYILTNSENKSYSIEVDCQSFVHMLKVREEKQVVFENVIYEEECSAIMENTNKCLAQGQNKCISFEDLYNPNCDC